MFNIRNRKTRQKVIRLRKKGTRKFPLYDIIVTFKDNRNRGSIIEKIGFFNPHIEQRVFFINSFRIAY
jgi:ribosomal protein S16